MHECACMSVRMHARVCMSVCACACVHAHVCVCMNVCARACVNLSLPVVWSRCWIPHPRSPPPAPPGSAEPCGFLPVSHVLNAGPAPDTPNLWSAGCLTGQVLPAFRLCCFICVCRGRCWPSSLPPWGTPAALRYTRSLSAVCRPAPLTSSLSPCPAPQGPRPSPLTVVWFQGSLSAHSSPT